MKLKAIWNLLFAKQFVVITETDFTLCRFTSMTYRKLIDHTALLHNDAVQEIKDLQQQEANIKESSSIVNKIG